MRVFALLLMGWISLQAMQYNPLQLNAEAMIFPKLLLLKKDPRSLLVDGRIRFCILYEPEDRTTAEYIRTRLHERYPDTIEGFPLEAVILPYNQLSADTHVSALLMLYSEKNVERAVAFAQKNCIVTFAYDTVYLEKGLLFALGIQRTTVIYLNRSALSKCRIAFSAPLYQIVRFIDGSAKSNARVH